VDVNVKIPERTREPEGSTTEHPSLKRSETMEEIKRILVVSRMTSDCRRAIHFGISLARKYGAELSVIHVLYNPFEYMNMPMISMDEEYKKDRQRIRMEIDEVIKKERKAAMAIKEIVKEGEPVAQIMKVIEDERIDLVVLHAHKDSYWDHFFYGYRSDEIIRKIPCSVLLVKERAAEA
jgi:universal stress protein A